MPTWIAVSVAVLMAAVVAAGLTTAHCSVRAVLAPAVVIAPDPPTDAFTVESLGSDTSVWGWTVHEAFAGNTRHRATSAADAEFR